MRTKAHVLVILEEVRGDHREDRSLDHSAVHRNGEKCLEISEIHFEGNNVMARLSIIENPYTRFLLSCRHL